MQAQTPIVPFWRTFLVFLLPLMLGNILQSLSGTINNIYLGQLLGVNALAAASVFFPILFLFISFVIGLSAGATVLVGQAYGGRQFDKVKKITGTVLATSFIGGVVIGIFTSIFADRLMMMLGVPADIFEEATAFARVSFLSMPIMFVFIIASSMLRGVGDTVTPLVALVVVALLGAFLTPGFILGWFGLPPLGVTSAAWAGMVSWFIALIALGFYLRWRKSLMAPDMELVRNLIPDPKILLLIIKIGVPTGIQMIAGAVAGIVIIGLINQFGSMSTAAYGAVNQVLSYVQFPALSIAIAASIFGAQAIGAGRIDQLNKVTRTALIFNIIFTGGLVLIAYLFSEHIIRLFVSDTEVLQLSQDFLHIVCWSSLLFGAGSILAGVMRASGDVIVPMLLSLFNILLIEIPVAYLLSRYYGSHGVWWGVAANFTMMLLFQGLYYQFVWRKKSIKKLI